MNGLTGLERRLLRLNAADRGWILEQLTSPQTSADSGNGFARALESVALQSIAPEVMAGVLILEPAWVGAVVLSDAAHAWRRSVLKSLPRTHRRRIEDALRRAIAVGPRVQDLVRNAATRAAGASGAGP